MVDRPAATAALELQGIVGGYQGSTVIREVSLRVPAGSVVALLGPNGAGKTTLLRFASGLLRPRNGRILVDGVDVTTMPPHRRERVGICHIPEGRAMFPSLTVKENIALQAGKGKEAAAIHAAIDAFPIFGTCLNKRASTLSGGQQQMLALIPAFLGSPRVVMVDEASLGLAPVLVDAIFTFLAQLAARGVAMLLVEQYVKRALDLATYAYVLDRGTIRFDGSPSELERNSILRSYLGAEYTAERPMAEPDSQSGQMV